MHRGEPVKEPPGSRYPQAGGVCKIKKVCYITQPPVGDPLVQEQGRILKCADRGKQ